MTETIDGEDVYLVRGPGGVLLTSRAGKFQPILGGRYMSEVYEINCWTL